MRHRSGITLIELLVAIGIAAVIGVVSFLLLQGRPSRAQLDTTTQQIATLLRDAQNRSVSGLAGASWGVHFANSTSTTPWFSLFKGTYSTTTETARYNLPAALRYATSTLAAGGTLDVLFAALTGIPSTSTAITLELQGSGSGGGGSTPASFGRSSSGEIFFDDFNRSSL